MKRRRRTLIVHLPIDIKNRRVYVARLIYIICPMYGEEKAREKERQKLKTRKIKSGGDERESRIFCLLLTL